jgi:hypothetical protein
MISVFRDLMPAKTKGDEEEKKKAFRQSTDRTKRLFYEDINKGLIWLRAKSMEPGALSSALCPLPFASAFASYSLRAILS